MLYYIFFSIIALPSIVQASHENSLQKWKKRRVETPEKATTDNFDLPEHETPFSIEVEETLHRSNDNCLGVATSANHLVAKPKQAAKEIRQPSLGSNFSNIYIRLVMTYIRDENYSDALVGLTHAIKYESEYYPKRRKIQLLQNILDDLEDRIRRSVLINKRCRHSICQNLNDLIE